MPSAFVIALPPGHGSELLAGRDGPVAENHSNLPQFLSDPSQGAVELPEYEHTASYRSAGSRTCSTRVKSFDANNDPCSWNSPWSVRILDPIGRRKRLPYENVNPCNVKVGQALPPANSHNSASSSPLVDQQAHAHSLPVGARNSGMRDMMVSK